MLHCQCSKSSCKLKIDHKGSKFYNAALREKFCTDSNHTRLTQKTLTCAWIRKKCGHISQILNKPRSGQVSVCRLKKKQKCRIEVIDHQRSLCINHCGITWVSVFKQTTSLLHLVHTVWKLAKAIFDNSGQPKNVRQVVYDVTVFKPAAVNWSFARVFIIMVLHFSLFSGLRSGASTFESAFICFWCRRWRGSQDSIFRCWLPTRSTVRSFRLICVPEGHCF